jgi:cytochrome b561
MRFRNSTQAYGIVAMSLHWVVAGLVVIAWFLGSFGDEIPRESERSIAFLIHISAGLAGVVLIIIRLLWRMGDPPPSPEPTMLGRWVGWAGTAMHYALYVLIAAVIVLGITVQFARGNALPVFGWFEIASPWTADRPFARTIKEFHEATANALMILVGIHTAAALFHHWILRDRTLLRMLPGQCGKVDRRQSLL